MIRPDKGQLISLNDPFVWQNGLIPRSSVPVSGTGILKRGINKLKRNRPGRTRRQVHYGCYPLGHPDIYAACDMM